MKTATTAGIRAGAVAGGAVCCDSVGSTGMAGNYPLGVGVRKEGAGVVAGGAEVCTVETGGREGEVAVEIAGGVVVADTVDTFATEGLESPLGKREVAVGAGADVVEEWSTFGFGPHAVSIATPMPTHTAAMEGDLRKQR